MRWASVAVAWRWAVLPALVSAAAAAALVAGVGPLLVAHLFPDAEAASPSAAFAAVDGGEAGYLAVRGEPPPSSWDEGAGRYRFGRWRRPVPAADLHPLTWAQRATQHKEWHWVGAASGSLLVGAAVMQLGYASQAVAYWYDAASGGTGKVIAELPVVGGVLGARFARADGAPSSAAAGCSSWGGHGPTVELCSDGGVMRVAIDARTAGGGALRANLSVDLSGDVLSFVYPIGPRRPAIVTKVAGAPAAGTVDTGRGPAPFAGVAMSDWTRSLARRLTVWNWAAASWVDARTGARVGMQLSAGCYEDAAGRGVESCVTVDGVVHALDDRVRFALPDSSRLHDDEWGVASDGGAVRYTFRPRDALHGAFHFGVLDGDLHHVWGTLHGEVSVGGTTYRLDGVPGVIEEHYALW